ncbi:MAG: hypothetical protein ACRD12_16775 [Acidimicrobiales bacterium]
MKRTFIFCAITLVALGGATAAWAQTSGERGAKREAARACLDEARAANPDAPKAELRDDVKACLEAKGIQLGGKLTDEQKAQAKACIEQAKAAGGEPVEIREAARSCLQQAGIDLPPRPGRPAKACLRQARADHEGDRAAIKEAVKACLGRG